jgi:hypothetical protein
MATKTARTNGAARRKATSATPLDHLHHALDDLGRAREGAGQQARDRIDAAADSVRDAATGFRSRAEDRASEWEHTLQRETDEVLVELGKLAIRAQRSPGALRELSAEIRHRKGELGPAGAKTPAKTST